METLTSRERELFDSLDEAAKSHPLVHDDDGVLRFEQRLFPDNRGQLIDDIWNRLADRRMSEDEFWKVYRDIGYGLGCYCELRDNESDGDEETEE